MQKVVSSSREQQNLILRAGSGSGIPLSGVEFGTWLDGKASKRQSVQDMPNNGKCKVLRIREEKYYIYENGGKFYVEQPYQSIMEISKDIYEKALPFATEAVE